MTVYALRHPDGRWLYNLPNPPEWNARSVIRAEADGQPMTLLRPNAAWWATDHEAQQLSIVGKPSVETVKYVLDDRDALSVKYPAELSPEQYHDRNDDDLWELYSPETVEHESPVHVFDGPFMVLEGREPPAPDQPQWKAQLPHELGTRPEYRHLFPGQIPGFREHVYKVIKTMPGVRHCFDGYHGYIGLHVTIEVPFDKPQTRWQADISRRTSKPLKSGRTVPVIVSRSLDLPVPASIAAPNYEAALAAWDQQVEFWLGIVRSATVVACSACRGTGHVAEGSEKYNHR